MQIIFKGRNLITQLADVVSFLEKAHTGYTVDPDLKRSAAEGATKRDVSSSPKRLRTVTEEDGELEQTVQTICTSTPVPKSRVLPKTWPVSQVQIKNNVRSFRCPVKRSGKSNRNLTASKAAFQFSSLTHATFHSRVDRFRL